MDGSRVMKVDFLKIKDIYEKEVRKNTKNKKKVYQFDRFKMMNLTKIYDVLSEDRYCHMRYHIFLIRSPKYRIVMSLNLYEKVINHYLTRWVLMPKLEKYLDIRNVATRKNMGRDYGIRLVKKYIEYYKKREFCYVLKLDISKYFYRIDHEVLKSMLKEKLTEEEYRLFCMIIDSTDEDSVNSRIEQLVNHELRVVKKRKQELLEVPLYEKGKGLPIGNMSSQFLSIFYLHALDHKIVHDYHIKHYVKYMDDMILFSDSKEKLKEVKEKIEKELEEKYLLKLNQKKTIIVNIKQGFNFCGYRFRVIDGKTVITVCKDTKERVKKRVKEVRYLYDTGQISFQSAFSSINTYYNGFQYGSKKKMRRIVDRYFFRIHR